MSRSIRLWVAAAGMVATCAIGIAVGTRMPRAADDAAFDARVRAAILGHPEILQAAAAKMQLAPYRAAIERPFAGAWSGNASGDVTLVVFSDYNCPYCRATSPEIDRLLAADPKLKVVWRELPVLGPGSETAAAMALAAAKQGKYPVFHRALFSGGHPDEKGIAAAAQTAGLVPASLAAAVRARDVQVEIQTNLEIARRLGIEATPFFVIGNQVFQGAVGYDRLAQAVAAARRERDEINGGGATS